MKKKKRNRVILAICSMFIACMSILAFIPKEKEIVKADSVNINYDFVGSNFYSAGIVYFTNPYETLGSITCNFQFSFSVNSSNSTITAKQSCFVDDVYAKVWNGFYENGMGVEYVNIPMDNQYHYVFIHFGDVSTDRYALMNCLMLVDSAEFTSNIFSVTFGSSFFGTLNNIPTSDFNYYYNYVKYTDVNNHSLYIVIPYSSIGNTSPDFNDVYYPFALQYRTYYLLNPNDFSDNEYYDSGYNVGFQNGLSYGNTAGYEDGYKVGKNDGYNLGYNEALSNEGKYTFDNLLSAVIDVPVRTFTSLFNFEILGVNLSGFFLGLLTCCIVITIVRLLL